MDCIFCKIVQKEKEAHLIYEDDFSLAVLDIFPRARGHSLILPKKHGETILDFSSQELGNLFEAVKKVTLLLKEKLKADGFTIGINHGKASGQVINHLHIHILPRFSNDGGGSIHSIINQPPIESLEEIKNVILS